MLNERADTAGIVYWVKVGPMRPAFSPQFFRSREIVDAIIENEVFRLLYEMGAVNSNTAIYECIS